MKKYFYIPIIILLLSTSQVFAQITLNGTTVELDGTVTADDILASTYFTSAGNIVTLDYNVLLKDNANLELRGLIIDINGFFFQPETANNAPEITGVAFLSDSPADHFRAVNLNLKNCTVMMHRNGSRIITLSKADNVIAASVGTPNTGDTRAGSVFLSQGGDFTSILLDNIDRFGVLGGALGGNGTYRIRNILYKGYNNNMFIGYNYSPSSIWEDLTQENTSSFTIDTFEAFQADHTILLLGESINTFYRGTSQFTRSNAHGNTRIRTGGIKYWNIIDGQGGTITVFDSRSINNPQRLILTLANWELLEAGTFLTIPANENVEFMVNTGEKTGTTNTTVLSPINAQHVFIKKFGKRISKTSYTTSAGANATEGSTGAYARLTLFDEDFVIESETNIRAFSELNTLSELAQRLHVLGLDTDRSDIQFDGNFASYNGNEIDFGSYNLIIDAAATNVISFDNLNTITVKSTTLISDTEFSSIRTTGTVSTASGASLEFGYEDITGINKYVALSNLVSADVVLIYDNILSATIVTVTGLTGDYKVHFLAPTNASDIEVSVTRPNFSTFSENYPENDLSFVRSINLQLTEVVAESQIEILNLTLKILQKEEAIYRALDLTNPPLNITNTISGTTGSPTVDNQQAILDILNKIFVKVIANRRKLE